jgi:hypothetical protein
LQWRRTQRLPTRGDARCTLHDDDDLQFLLSHPPSPSIGTLPMSLKIELSPFPSIPIPSRKSKKKTQQDPYTKLIWRYYHLTNLQITTTKTVFCVGSYQVFGAGSKIRYPSCDTKNQLFMVSVGMD